MEADLGCDNCNSGSSRPTTNYNQAEHAFLSIVFVWSEVFLALRSVIMDSGQIAMAHSPAANLTLKLSCLA